MVTDHITLADYSMATFGSYARKRSRSTSRLSVTRCSTSSAWSKSSTGPRRSPAESGMTETPPNQHAVAPAPAGPKGLPGAGGNAAAGPPSLLLADGGLGHRRRRRGPGNSGARILRVIRAPESAGLALVAVQDCSQSSTRPPSQATADASRSIPRRMRPTPIQIPTISCPREQAITLAMARFLQLAPSQRSCVILKDVLDYSLEDIATCLDLSIPAVKAALHRGPHPATALPDAARDHNRSIPHGPPLRPTLQRPQLGRSAGHAHRRRQTRGPGRHEPQREKGGRRLLHPLRQHARLAGGSGGAGWPRGRHCPAARQLRRVDHPGRPNRDDPRLLPHPLPDGGMSAENRRQFVPT